jgi:predicted CoA-binding protein
LNDQSLRELLTSARTIAVVGHSDKPWRDSYRIGAFLRAVGYTVYPVNPHIRQVLGQQAYPALADLPETVDIVDVFRAPEHLPGLVEETLASGARALWTQLGVVHPAAESRAREAGLPVVVNMCIKVEHQRLLGGAA